MNGGRNYIGVGITEHLAGSARTGAGVISQAQPHRYASLSYTAAVAARELGGGFTRAIARWFDALIEAKRQARPFWADEPLRVICAWCPDFNPRDPNNVGASHGMCAKCVRVFREDV